MSLVRQLPCFFFFWPFKWWEQVSNWHPYYRQQLRMVGVGCTFWIEWTAWKRLGLGHRFHPPSPDINTQKRIRIVTSVCPLSIHSCPFVFVIKTMHLSFQFNLFLFSLFSFFHFKLPNLFFKLHGTRKWLDIMFLYCLLFAQLQISLPSISHVSHACYWKN